MRMKEEALRAVGLNEKEIAVYLSCLKLGSALVQDIAHDAHLNRTSAYDILASLERKGFVSFTISSGKRYYQGISPSKILGILRESENLIKDSLPELNAISQSFVKKPKVEIYLGKNGLKSLFEGILEEAKSFYCIASKKHLSKLFEFYFPHFVKRRIKKGIKVKILSDEQPYDKNAPYKIIKGEIKTATWLYNGKIVMVSLEEKEPVGILIDEKNFYETHKMMFELIWESL